MLMRRRPLMDICMRRRAGGRRRRRRRFGRLRVGDRRVAQPRRPIGRRPVLRRRDVGVGGVGAGVVCRPASVRHLLPVVFEGVPEQRDGDVAVHVRPSFQSGAGRQRLHLPGTAARPRPPGPALHLPLDGQFSYLFVSFFFLFVSIFAPRNYLKTTTTTTQKKRTWVRIFWLLLLLLLLLSLVACAAT